MSQTNITLNAMSGGSVVSTDSITDGSNAQQIKLLDGTPGSANPLVVNANGNANIQFGAADVTSSTNLTATGSTLAITQTGDDASVAVMVSGTWVGTVVVEGSIDGGTTYYILNVTAVGGTTAVASITANGLYKADISGFPLVRVRFSARTSGTAVVRATATAVQIQPIGLTQTVAISGSLAVAGDVASGSTDSGNPAKIGGKALNAVPTSVSTAQRTNALFDTMGRLIVSPQIRQGVLFKSTVITSSTTATTIIAAAASTYNDLTHLTITNGDSTATAVTISDGTTTLGIYNIPAGGGVVLTYPTPVPQTTANTNWTATCSVGVNSLYVSAVYQTSK